MKYNHAAIFAETPFQLISGLNIAFNHLKAQKVTLFLTRKMYESNREFIINDTSKLIDNVYYLKRNAYAKSFTGRVFQKIKFTLTNEFEFLCENVLPNDITVDCVIGMKYSTPIIHFLKMYKIYLPLYLFEEGIGDYLQDRKDTMHNSLKVFQNNKFIASITQYAMLPILFEKINNIRCESLTSAPNEEFKSILSSVFFNEKEDLNNINIIYLDRTISIASKENQDRFLKIEEQVFNLLKIIDNKTAVKIHPRSVKEYENKTLLKSPWEILLSNNMDKKNIVAISTPTTAFITPKCLLGLDVMIIDLSILFKDYLIDLYGEEAYNNFLEINENIRLQYKNKELVQMPKTFDELESIINNLKEQ